MENVDQIIKNCEQEFDEIAKFVAETKEIFMKGDAFRAKSHMEWLTNKPNPYDINGNSCEYLIKKLESLAELQMNKINKNA